MSDDNDNDENKVIQIIPAPAGVSAVFGNDDDSIYREHVDCIGLSAGGNILYLTICGDGCFDSPIESTNFLGYEKSPEPDDVWQRRWIEKQADSKRDFDAETARVAALPAWKREKQAYEENRRDEEIKARVAARREQAARNEEIEREQWERIKALIISKTPPEPR